MQVCQAPLSQHPYKLYNMSNYVTFCLSSTVSRSSQVSVKINQNISSQNFLDCLFDWLTHMQ